MSRRWALLGALATLVATGCTSDPPPAESFYELTPSDPGRRFGTPLLDGTLVVERFDAEGVIGERALLYKGGDGPRLQQYTYHHWTQAPAVLLRDAAITAYRRAGVATRVVSPSARLLPDYRMTGSIRRLHHRRGSPSGAAVLAVEITIPRARDGAALLLERYRDRAPVATTRIGDAVTGFRTALTVVLTRSIDDLAARVGR